MLITREKFIAATGREPLHDDLLRCNCTMLNEDGHLWCGWNTEKDRPQFEIGPRDLDRVSESLWIAMETGRRSVMVDG